MIKKNSLWLVLAGIALTLTVAGIWFLSSHIQVGGRFYSLSARQLDLRGTGTSAEDYSVLRQAMPECEILWDVAFQGEFLPPETEQITVTSLTDDEVSLLDSLADLRRVDAMGCTDYPQLQMLMTRHPDCQVCYRVAFGDRNVDWDAKTAELTDVSAAALNEKLPLLPQLERVDLQGQLPAPGELEALQSAFPQVDFRWHAALGGKVFPGSAVRIFGMTLSDAAELEEALPLLPKLETIDLTGSGLTDEACRALHDKYAQKYTFLWELTVGSVTVRTDVKELDLQNWTGADPDEVEAAVAYLPKLERVDMSGCGIPSEVMHELDERHENVRFIWSFKIRGIPVRTDDTWFAPVKYGGRVSGNDLYDLRYCTDMVCIDIGHMQVSDCEWAAYMPNLTYLIIGDTPIGDLTPLSGLKNLKFLEMFMTPVKDYSPLVGCTGLEDLNIGFTRAAPDPIYEMTWLKNLWWSMLFGINDAGGNPAWKMLPEKLPYTNISANALDSSTAGGWRRLPNYYAMRDYIGMGYMDG